MQSLLRRVLETVHQAGMAQQLIIGDKTQTTFLRIDNFKDM